jgi:hypothetical protein
MTLDDFRTNAISLYQPNDMIALRMGRLAANRVTPETLRQFGADLNRLHSRTSENVYLRIWRAAIAEGPGAVRNLLIEPSQRGQVLRSMISFRAFVSKPERDAIFSENARAVAGAWGAHP